MTYCLVQAQPHDKRVAGSTALIADVNSVRRLLPCAHLVNLLRLFNLVYSFLFAKYVTSKRVLLRSLEGPAKALIASTQIDALGSRRFLTPVILVTVEMGDLRKWNRPLVQRDDLAFA